MSQAGIINNAVLPPGAGVQTLTGDLGAAVGPDGANNIDLLTGPGLTSTGVPGTHTITFTLDGSGEGTVQTIGAVTGDVITVPLGAVPGTYTFEARIAAFNASTPAGAGYQIFGAVRTTGAAAVLIGTPDIIVNEEAALVNGDADLVVSANNAIFRVTGVAGLTIDWKCNSTFTMVT